MRGRRTSIGRARIGDLVNPGGGVIEEPGLVATLELGSLSDSGGRDGAMVGSVGYWSTGSKCETKLDITERH